VKTNPGSLCAREAKTGQILKLLLNFKNLIQHLTSLRPGVPGRTHQLVNRRTGGAHLVPGPPRQLSRLFQALRRSRPENRPPKNAEREFFIDNLLVRIHYTIVMIRWTGLAPWAFEFPFPGSLTSTFLRTRKYVRLQCKRSKLFQDLTSLCSDPPSGIDRVQKLVKLRTRSGVSGSGFRVQLSGFGFRVGTNGR